jgi:tetratricopeptide (TPR) repeat protein
LAGKVTSVEERWTIYEREDMMDQNSQLGALDVLLIIALAGGFGGFVDGLITKTEYTLRLPFWKTKRWNENVPNWAEIDFGTLGDILVGAAAGIALFIVAGGLLNVKVSELSKDPDAYLRAVALGLLAGFSGLKLLGGLSRKLVEDISTKTALETVKREIQKNVDVAVYVKEADALLNLFDAEYKELPQHSGPQAAETGKILDKALAKYDAALSDDPANEEALRGKARAYRRQATVAGDQGNSADSATLWNKAIETLSSILERNNQSAPSYYNRACYKHLAGRNVDEALSDLAKALALAPRLKQYAQHDTDFTRLWANNEFKTLTE